MLLDSKLHSIVFSSDLIVRSNATLGIIKVLFTMRRSFLYAKKDNFSRKWKPKET